MPIQVTNYSPALITDTNDGVVAIVTGDSKVTKRFWEGEVQKNKIIIVVSGKALISIRPAVDFTKLFLT